jgi:hypothetical protein
MNTSLLVTESLTNKDVFISFIEINNSTQLAKKIRTFSFLNASLKEPRRTQNSHRNHGHVRKSPLSVFFISSTKIHLQDLTRGIGDSASKVVLPFCYKEGICIQRAPSKKHTKNTAAAPHHKKPAPQSILGRLLHLEHQNSSPGLDEGDW